MKSSVDGRCEKKQPVCLIYGARLIKRGEASRLRQEIYAKNCINNNSVTFVFLNTN